MSKTNFGPLEDVALVVDGGDPLRAEEIATQLGIRLVDADDQLPEFLLELTSEKLSLQRTSIKEGSPVFVDFVGGKAAYRRGQSELITKAVGVHKYLPMTVVDATAGLGRDAFVLASKGCDVILIERHPVIFALLEDGLQRALLDASTREAASRMQLFRSEAVDWMKSHREQVDVVYLDPMFPASKKNAAVKKEMQLFHDLLADEPDTSTLLETARGVAKLRVVVKRPVKAAPLREIPPSYSARGRSTRFDVYLNAG